MWLIHATTIGPITTIPAVHIIGPKFDGFLDLIVFALETRTNEVSGSRLPRSARRWDDLAPPSRGSAECTRPRECGHREHTVRPLGLVNGAGRCRSSPAWCPGGPSATCRGQRSSSSLSELVKLNQFKAISNLRSINQMPTYLDTDWWTLCPFLDVLVPTYNMFISSSSINELFAS